MEPQIAVVCPECGDTRVFHDGFREAPLNSPTNTPIQRYRCSAYGHRWSQHIGLNVLDNNKESSHVGAKKAKNMIPT
jgi:transposase-like protein